MSMTEIRSIVVSTQETLRESGTAVTPATVKVIAAAVVTWSVPFSVFCSFIKDDGFKHI